MRFQTGMERVFALVDAQIEGHISAQQAKTILHDEFGSEWTVLVLDMSRFTETAFHRGIAYSLHKIRLMHRVVSPVIESDAFDGRIIKVEADNVYAVFEQPQRAYDCAEEIFDALDAFNANRSAMDRIHIAVGLAHGEILLAAGDFYGNAVNIACKLGEDVAVAGEIAVDDSCWSRLSRRLDLPCHDEQASIHGAMVGYRRLVAREYAEPASPGAGAAG